MTAVAKMPEPSGDVIDQEAGLLAIIERAARDPNTDVDKMERLFALHERMLARASEIAFSEAMTAAQAEMPQVIRDGKNSTTNSTYTNLETLAAKVDPVAHKHGFSLSYGTADSPLENHYRVTCRVRHRGGFFEDRYADIPADTVGMKGTTNKTPTHGFGSTMSYGRRYLKLLIFDIATTDDDGQAATTGEPVSFKELDDLQRRAAQVGANEAKLVAALKVPSLAMLPAARFREAMAKIDAFELRKTVERLPE